MKTKKSIALVTGSTRGIGKAIAKKLCNEGYIVIITGTKKETLNKTVAELENSGGDVFGIASDLLVSGAPQKLVDAVLAQYGKLDVLINNAGTAHADSFIKINENDFDYVMGLNVKAPLFLTQAALPSLLKSPEKVIINISSVVGHKAYANQSLYASSKHALNGMMSALAKEYRSDGLRVYNIAPGGVATEMIRTARPDLKPETLIQPEEVADTVAFLLALRGNAQIDEIHIRRRDNTPFE